MKRFFSLLLLAAGAASAQITVNIGTVTVPNEVSTAVETWRMAQTISTPAPVTLIGSITSGALSGTVSDASAIVAGSQIVIDSEAINVTVVTGNVLTWTRGATITTAAAHANGAVVKICKYASAVALMKKMIQAEVNALLNQQPSTTLQTQTAAKATADAAISAFLASTVQ